MSYTLWFLPDLGLKPQCSALEANRTKMTKNIPIKITKLFENTYCLNSVDIHISLAGFNISSIKADCLSKLQNLLLQKKIIIFVLMW